MESGNGRMSVQKNQTSGQEIEKDDAIREPERLSAVEGACKDKVIIFLVLTSFLGSSRNPSYPID